MATYRGMDGSIALATTAIAEVYGWTVNSTLATLEDTVLGDDWQTFKPGLGSWTASARCRLDYGDTAGQKALLDELIGATPQGDVADIRFRIDGTTKYLSGAAIVTGSTIVAELGNIIDLALTLQGNGPLAITWS